MCSLYFLVFYLLNTYHTSGKNIQILVKMNFKIFSDFNGIRYNNSMGILENFENAWDIDFQEDLKEPENLSTKIFSETVCENCSEKSIYESSPMMITDNMGREVFWEDLGRPEGP